MKAKSEKMVKQTHRYSRRYFKDADDFNKYMFSVKPKLLWSDEDLKHEPYIIFSFNDGVKFWGKYNNQILIGGEASDFKWLFRPNIYVKVSNN